MQWTFWMALVVVALTVAALIKRYETRLVLLTAGVVMALLSFNPLAAFQQFDKSMTSGALIIAICSAMGFAAVVSMTKCDLHLVALLTKPLRRAGVLLLPACAAVTGVVSIAIPSTAGCCAAVAPTLIPLMVRAGFHPAVAAAAVVSSITPAMLNPGISHNVFVAKLAEMEVIELIGHFSSTTLGLSALGIVVLTVTCVVYRDYRAGEDRSSEMTEAGGVPGGKKLPELPAKVNLLWAAAPLVPVVLLVVFSLWVPGTRISVATAMLVGMVYTMAVTRSSPDGIVRQFFDGMGKGYANILGIIIAAGVFAAGLKAAGVVDAFITYLTQANEVAKLGGAAGPFILAVLTGSGDAAAFAFNEAVTPHAAEFGLTIENLGYLAAMAGGFGRLMSPLAGGMILVAGIAGVSPLAVVKRTAPAMLVMVTTLYFLS